MACKPNDTNWAKVPHGLGNLVVGDKWPLILLPSFPANSQAPQRGLELDHIPSLCTAKSGLSHVFFLPVKLDGGQATPGPPPCGWMQSSRAHPRLWIGGTARSSPQMDEALPFQPNGGKRLSPPTHTPLTQLDILRWSFGGKCVFMTWAY